MDIGALINMLGAAQGGQPQMGQAASGAAGGFDLGNLLQMAQQMGFSPDQAGAVLGQLNNAAASGHTDIGAMANHAAGQTGMDAGMIGQLLQQMMGGMSGAAGQGQMGGMMGMAADMLDQNNDGSVIDDLMGMAGKMMKS